MPRGHWIEESTFGDPEVLILNVRWNNALFIVNLIPNPHADAMENHIVKRHAVACRSGDEDTEFAIQDEVLTAIEQNGESITEKLGPESEEEPSDLHSLVFPREFQFNLVTVAGKWEFLPVDTYHLEIPTEGDLTSGYKSFHLREDASQIPEPKFSLPIRGLDVKEIGIDVPTYITTDIQVVGRLLGEGYITRVKVDGQEMCAKVLRKRYDTQPFQRELECLAKITFHSNEHTPPPEVNVPKLLGLVKTPGEDGHIIGFLETLIPSPGKWELSNLRNVENMSAIPKERREKWARQIRSIVDWLHSIGVVWGDGKTENVLIHAETDDAWVIDFGGGRTRGWVDEELEGTVEGDEQVVGKIIEKLMVEI